MNPRFGLAQRLLWLGAITTVLVLGVSGCVLRNRLHDTILRSLAASSFSHARTVPPWQRAPEARAGISYPGMSRAIPTIPEADHRLMIARTRASRLIP